MEKLISQGAEAHVLKGKKWMIKERRPKGYRIPQIDSRLIAQRTRKEAKLLQKAFSIIKVPQVANVTDDTIVMTKIKGNKLADCLDRLSNKSAVAKQIGLGLGKLHDSGIIHGDLTTSNLIYDGKAVYFIDFGLGFESDNMEDKAVDLHVLKEALEAKHPTCADSCFKAILNAYKSSKSSSKVLERLKIVESRGRYKANY